VAANRCIADTIGGLVESRLWRGRENWPSGRFQTTIDSATERAARAFLERVADRYDVVQAILFGSRARGDRLADSDADLAVVLGCRPGEFFGTQRELSGIAYDVLLDTDIRIQALPIWQEEWRDPDSYSNPYLLRKIQREGVRL